MKRPDSNNLDFPVCEASNTFVLPGYQYWMCPVCGAWASRRKDGMRRKHTRAPREGETVVVVQVVTERKHVYALREA